MYLYTACYIWINGSGLVKRKCWVTSMKEMIQEYTLKYHLGYMDVAKKQRYPTFVSELEIIFI